MPPRMVITGGRTVISKPGYDAAATLADIQKIFDSNWGFTGIIVARGEVTIPSGVTTYTIPFPTQHFVPCAEVIPVGAGSVPISGYCTSSSIVLEAIDYNPGNSTSIFLPSGLARYVVYGISQ